MASLYRSDLLPRSCSVKDLLALSILSTSVYLYNFSCILLCIFHCSILIVHNSKFHYDISMYVYDAHLYCPSCLPFLLSYPE